jgi:threonine/homoserine efflux transporter RhtA
VSESILKSQTEDNDMNFHFAVEPVVALIAGILILAVPRLLNYIVAIYLIVIGVVGVFGR